MIVTETQLKALETEDTINYEVDQDDLIETIRELRACLTDVAEAWAECYNEDWDGFDDLWDEYERVMGG